MLRVSLLICSPQAYSVKSNPDKKKEDVFPFKLTETIFASLYHYFAVAAALKFFLSARTKYVSFPKIVCLHYSVFPLHLEFQSLMLWEDGEDPEAKLCSKWVLTSRLIAHRLSLSSECDTASLKEFWSLCSGGTLEWFWCWNDHVVLKISLQLTLLPEQALLVGCQICTSLRSVLTLSLHCFSAGGKGMQRRPKELA